MTNLERAASLGTVEPLAVAPPITIGELLDVPAPRSGIKSAWAQEVTQRIIHRFANAAARDAWAGPKITPSWCYLLDTKRFQVWDGVAWFTVYDVTVGGNYVAKTGDTMTGALSVQVGGAASGGLGINGGIGFQVGTHPAHGSVYAALWRNDKAGAGDYAFMQSSAGATYINASSGQTIAMRVNNASVLDITAGQVSIAGSAPLAWPAYGGGWYMSDTTWIRSYNGKKVYLSAGAGIDGGVVINAGGAFPGSWALGITGAASLYHMSGSPRIYHNGGVATYEAAVLSVVLSKQSGNWSTQQIRVDQAGGGASEAGITLWNEVNGAAPIMRNYGQFGDRFDFLNSANSAYCGLNASAFTVTSSLRIKRDVVQVGDDELLWRIAGVRTHRFWPVIRPQTLRPSERFRRINERWQAHGHRPLKLRDEHVHGADHDCAIDNCYGTAERPCCITGNDTMRYGLIAEHLHREVPEAVSLDENLLPAGYDVDQVAAMAFGGVGALVRLVTDLQQRIEQLEVMAHVV